MTALISRCAARRGRRRAHSPDPRSGRTGARRSRLPPGPGPGCGRGAGRPSCAGAGDDPVDPPGWGSGVPKPPRLRPRAGSGSLFLGAPAALTCARTTGRPAARQTDPDRPAGGPAGAAQMPRCTRPPSDHRPSSTSRIQLAIGSKMRPSVPYSTALPRKDGNALHYPLIYRNIYTK